MDEALHAGIGGEAAVDGDAHAGDEAGGLVVEEEEDGEIEYVEVRDDDRGLAIGKEGRNIIKAKKLAFRQFDVSNVELKQDEVEEEDEFDDEL